MLGLKAEYFDGEIDSPVLKHREAGPFRIGRLLGKGVSGSAYLGTHKTTGFQVALKIVKKSRFVSNPERLKVLRREIAVMKLMDHPHVLKLYDVFESSDRIFLVTELAQGGELFDYIKDGVLPIRTALKLFAQITMGLLHCHNHGIAHRDLKPENLLLDGEGNIKIADFGMAQVVKEGTFLKTTCGSPHYVSPELIDGKYDGKTSDVWSLGVILYAIVTGCLPFDHQNVPTLLRIVQKGEFEIPEEVDPEVQELIRAMLKVDVKERIKMEDIFQHRVFQEGNYFSEKDKSYFSSETPRDSVVDSIDDSVLADVLAVLGVENKDEVQAKILEPGENTEKSLYLLLMDRKNRRLLQLTRLSPRINSSRTLASSTRSSGPSSRSSSQSSSRSSSPTPTLTHRRIIEQMEAYQLPDLSTARADSVEITSKFLLEKAQLVESNLTTPNESRRSSVSDSASSLPSSGAPSTAPSTNPSRRGSGLMLNVTVPSSAPSSVGPSRRESLITPALSSPTSRRASVNEEQPSTLELLRRHFLKKLGVEKSPVSPTSHRDSTSPGTSRCTSPILTPRSSRCSSPARSVFASFFRRRPSLDPWHNSASSPRDRESRSGRRPRSTSLPTAEEEIETITRPSTTISTSTSPSPSPSPTPSPSFTLLVPSPTPSTPSSTMSVSSLFSPTSPSTATLVLPTLFEERT